MLSAATTSRMSLPRKKKMPAESPALAENSRLPVTAAKANATQVQGRTSRVNLPTGRSKDARPRRRRSRIEIEPTTSAMASTCTDSTQGKRISFSRISVASAVASSHFSPGSNHMDLVIGDPATAEDDGDPEGKGGQGNQRRAPSALGEIIPLAAARKTDLIKGSERQRCEQESHLQLE